MDLTQDIPNSYSIKLGSLAQSDVPVPCFSHLVLILLTSHGHSTAVLFCTAPGRALVLFPLASYTVLVYVIATGYVSWVVLDEIYLDKVNLFPACSSVVMNNSWRLLRLL